MSWASPVSASGSVAPVAAESSWVSDTITSLSSSSGFRSCSAGANSAAHAVIGATPADRLAEHVENQLGEPEVEEGHKGGHDDYEDHAYHRVGDKLVAGRPDNLAKFRCHLPEKQGGRGALGRATGSAPFLRGLTACLSCHILT